MVEDAVAHLLGQVEAATVALQHLDHAQRVLVVLEAAVAALAQGSVERLLAGMAKRRVAEIVTEPDRLGQVLVEAERAGDGASDPAGLQRVGQPGPVVVALGGDEDLGLVLEPPEGLAVDNAIAIALERRADWAVRLLDRPQRWIGPRCIGSKKLRLPGGDAVLEACNYGHLSILGGRAQLHMRMVSNVSPDGTLDLAQGLFLGARSLGQGAADRADHEAVRVFGERETARFAAGADDPAGSPGEAAQVLGLAAVGTGGELGRETGRQGELEPEGERRLQARRPRLVRVVEQRQVAAEQVVGGWVGLGRVEQGAAPRRRRGHRH